MYSVSKKFIKRQYALHRTSKKKNPINTSGKKLPPQSGKVAWLIPDKPEYEIYSESIELLSNRFNTPLFSPHMTFGSLPDLPAEEIAPAFEHILDDLETLRFISDYIRCSATPYQNLVHQYKLDEQFRKVSKGLKSHLPGFEPKEEIHISLMYGYVPCDIAEKQGTELETRLPLSTRISEIQIIGLAEKVSEWKVLHRHSV
jgi:hypothetical protein